MREIEIDSEGNITSITKLDPDKMHLTAKTRFALLDQNKQAGSLELGKRSRASEKSQSMTGTPSVLGSESKYPPRLFGSVSPFGGSKMRFSVCGDCCFDI